MLVLTRNLDETIVIEGRIRVTVLSAKGDKIRLGITAPANVRVDREEVHARIVEAGLCEQPSIVKVAPPSPHSDRRCMGEPS